MEKIFEILFKAANSERSKSCYEANILKNIEKNNLLLKKHLSQKERKLLLRVIDGKDLITENTAMNNFTDGFRLGVKLGIELYGK